MVSQKKKAMTFSKFKVTFRSFEEIESSVHQGKF